MPKPVLELSTKQAEQLLDQLPPAVKIRLVRRWKQQDWAVQFRRLLDRIDARLRKNPQLRRDALRVIEPARREFYARRGNRH